MSKTRDTLISANEAKKRLMDLVGIWFKGTGWVKRSQVRAIIDTLAKEGK